MTVTVTPASYNLGRDATFSIVDPFHRAVPLAPQSAGIRKIRAHDGNPELWEVTLTFDRAGGGLDYLFGEIETAERLGDGAMHFAILQSVQDPDGHASQFSFPKMTAFYESAGTYAGDGKVEQTVVFCGKRRLIVQ